MHRICHVIHGEQFVHYAYVCSTHVCTKGQVVKNTETQLSEHSESEPEPVGTYLLAGKIKDRIQGLELGAIVVECICDR